MNNSAENIVTVWLQEFAKPRRHFTMNNVYVHRKKDKKYKLKPGLGPEIDILSTDGKKYYWIEVSVPSRPWAAGRYKGRSVAKDYIKKFTPEKARYIAKYLKLRRIEKWLVYSPKFFKEKSDEENKFKKLLRQNRIKSVSFENILKDIHEHLNYRGYDETRNYLFLLKQFKFGNDNNQTNL